MNTDDASPESDQDDELLEPLPRCGPGMCSWTTTASSTP
jgi:hypothetical protein